MTMFRQVSKLYGSMTPTVENYVAKGIDALVLELLVKALETWRALGWQRFDDREANCTIQVFRHAVACQGATRALRILRIDLEWHQPTREMLLGLESAEGMTRPDMRLTVGRASWIIECKRLKLSDNLPRRYVEEGMMRFVDGRYGGSALAGAMLGYVVADEPAEIVGAINLAVVAAPQMGEAHQLIPDGAGLGPLLDSYRSNHDRVDLPPFQLLHLLADVRL